MRPVAQRGGTSLQQHAAARDHVGARQRLERRVGLEELAHLVLGRPPAEPGEAADDLHVGEVPRREHVVAALALQRELLDRPRADLADRAQAQPRRLVLVEVDPARGHLARDLDHRQRPLRREVARRELGGRAAGERLGRRRVAPAAGRRCAAPSGRSAGAGSRRRGRSSISCSVIAKASASNGSALRSGRIIGQRRITGPISGSRRKRLVELGEVLVEPAEEAHPLDAVERRLAGGRIGGHADSARRGPGAGDRGLVAEVHEPDEAGTAAAQEAAAGGPRQPVGARRHEIALNGDVQRFRRWMSTRNDRDSAISIFLPPRRPPTRTFRPRGWRSRNRTNVATPDEEPARRGQHRRGQRHDPLGERRGRPLDRPDLVDLREDWQRFRQDGELLRPSSGFS